MLPPLALLDKVVAPDWPPVLVVPPETDELEVPPVRVSPPEAEVDLPPAEPATAELLVVLLAPPLLATPPALPPVELALLETEPPLAPAPPLFTAPPVPVPPLPEPPQPSQGPVSSAANIRGMVLRGGLIFCSSRREWCRCMKMI